MGILSGYIQPAHTVNTSTAQDRASENASSSSTQHVCDWRWAPVVATVLPRFSACCLNFCHWWCNSAISVKPHCMSTTATEAATCCIDTPAVVPCVGIQRCMAAGGSHLHGILLRVLQHKDTGCNLPIGTQPTPVAQPVSAFVHQAGGVYHSSHKHKQQPEGDQQCNQHRFEATELSR